MKNPSGISVAVCTFKSPETLGAALESLGRQEIGDECLEILLVDNGGLEETRSIAERFHGATPHSFRYVREPELGLSRARNRALRESGHRVIAFIDDDARACPRWARSLFEAFENAKVRAVGGPVEPLWEASRPGWLEDELLRSLSVVEWGKEDRWLVWPERIIGTNMAFDRNFLLDLGGFDEQLGRKGRSLAGMEDTVLQERMHREGFGVFYRADAVVHHLVPANRCRESYFFRRTMADELSKLRVGTAEVTDTPTPKQFLVALRGFLESSIRYGYRRFRHPSKRIRPLLRAARHWARLRFPFERTENPNP